MMCIDNQSDSENEPLASDYFFLCLFFLRRFLRLCVAILCFFLFLPLGINNVLMFTSFISKEHWLSVYFKSFR
jgi:hypothetical protein